MAGNFKQPGSVLDLTAPTDGVVSGSGYLIGGLFVVALGNADEGEPFRGQRDGVWVLPKTSAQAWTEGQKIFWDDTGAECTTVATAGQLIGVAAAAAANPTATGEVLLNGVAPTALEGAQAAIADFAALTDSPATADALRDDLVATWLPKLNTLLAELRIAGIIAP